MQRLLAQRWGPLRPSPPRPALLPRRPEVSADRGRKGLGLGPGSSAEAPTRCRLTLKRVGPGFTAFPSRSQTRPRGCTHLWFRRGPSSA